MNQAVTFGLLLAGGVLLESALSGSSLGDVVKGHPAKISTTGVDLTSTIGNGVIGGLGSTIAGAVNGAANTIGELYPGVPKPEAGQYATSGAQGPSGLATFDGVQVAAWILPELQYARAHGWTGRITSGYRAGGSSEHAGTQYPGGAVDFGGPGGAGSSGWLARADFFAHTAGYTGLKLIPAQFGPYSAYPQGDGGHASGNGH